MQIKPTIVASLSFVTCVLFSAGCNDIDSGSKKISSGQAIGLAFDDLVKDDLLRKSLAYEISVENSNQEWLVSIEELPSKYPGDHTIVVLDEFGNVIRINPGL